MHGNLARFGLKNKALYADDVADVRLFEVLVLVNAHIVATEITLHSAVAVHDVAETCLAHNAFGHKSARDADFLALELVVVCKDLSCGCSALV